MLALTIGEAMNVENKTKTLKTWPAVAMDLQQNVIFDSVKIAVG